MEAIAHDDMTPWLVESVGWHQLKATMEFPAVLIVAASSAAEAAVKAVASVSAHFFADTPFEVVSLKVPAPTPRPAPIIYRYTRRPTAMDADLFERMESGFASMSAKSGWRVDVVVLASTGKRFSITAWANATVPAADPANAPS